MSILIDTGPLAAYLNEGDRLHPRADAMFDRILAGQWGMPVSTDFVLDEGLTLLRRRPGKRTLSERFARLFLGDVEGQRMLHMLSTTPDLLDEARDVHFAHWDRGLSFTDATLVAHARHLDAVVATFDGGFDGLVPTVADA